MLTVNSREQRSHGEIWYTEVDDEKHDWLFMTLPYLVLHDDLGTGPVPSMQQDSDLDLLTLPYYFCKVPSSLFFPFITCTAENRFGMPFGPTFLIPRLPLNRIESRNWLTNISAHQLELINLEQSGFQHGWIKPDGSVYTEEGWPLDELELKRLATTVKSYFLDDIRYVYDEAKRSSDGSKTSLPNRHNFSADIAAFDTTKEYLSWYIDRFNVFFDKLLTIGQAGTAEKRQLCLVAGWTLNRLAVDMLTISLTDVPYLRKWQFFAFLDTLAALKNEFDGTGHVRTADSDTARAMLTTTFWRDAIEPVIDQIPIAIIRNELVTHARHQYDEIDRIGLNGKSGPDVLWLYRNSRHGYTLRKDDKRMALLKHTGKIPNDLPDLAIALWHYLLLRFPDL